MKKYLYNLSDERVLLDVDSDERVEIASLTKIMTTWIAIDNNSNFQKNVVVTESALQNLDEFAVLGLKQGDIVTIEELMYATMLPSDADAAQALAIATSGSIEKFVDKMNDRVAELGLQNTHFSNVAGFDKDNYSTAADIAVILENALKNATFKTIFETYSYFINSLDITVKKTIEQNDVIVGAKTGYTNKAGRCLASTANINGAELLLVNLGGDVATTEHIDDSLSVYSYFENNYSYQTILEQGAKLTEIEVKDSPTKKLEFFADEDVEKFLENDFNLDQLQYSYSGIRTITRDLKIGDELGTYSIMLDSETLYETHLYLETELHFYQYWLWNIGAVAILAALAVFFVWKRQKARCKARRRG